MSVISEVLSVDESALTKEQRDKIPDKDFGVPELRSYPMPDKEHVIYAIRMFKFCKEEYRRELAKKIKSKAKEFGVSINKDSEVFKYL